MTTATIRAMKTSDESRGDETAGFAADAELFLDLEAGAAYWVELCLNYRTPDSYAGALNTSLRFDGVLYEPGMHIQTRGMSVYYVNLYEDGPGIEINLLLSQSAMASTTSLFNSTSDSTALRGMFIYSGRLTTTTAGRLALWWKHSDNGFGTPPATVIFTGSWMYATPLDICPI
jgi:hypothetical protein